MSSNNRRAAIVTGAGRGIGGAIASELAAGGFNIIVNYAERRDAAEETVAAIHAMGGDALAVQADVRRAADLDRLFDTAKERFGRLDVLVNNAGVSGTGMLEQIDGDMLGRAVAVNLSGTVLACQRAARAFGADGGVIVNLSSALTLQPVPSQAVYAATKAAVDAFTRVIAQELGPRGIRVNAVAPGPTEAGLLQVNDEMRGFLKSRTALGRLGQPQDIARVVAFLASDAAGWITGQVIGVDGGFRI